MLETGKINISHQVKKEKKSFPFFFSFPCSTNQRDPCKSFFSPDNISVLVHANYYVASLWLLPYS